MPVMRSLKFFSMMVNVVPSDGIEAEIELRVLRRQG